MMVICTWDRHVTWDSPRGSPLMDTLHNIKLFARNEIAVYRFEEIILASQFG